MTPQPHPWVCHIVGHIIIPNWCILCDFIVSFYPDYPSWLSSQEYFVNWGIDSQNIRFWYGKGWWWHLHENVKGNKNYGNVLWSSGISWKSGALTVRYSQKKECISFVFYCFENLSIDIALEPLVQFRWGFQQNVPLVMKPSTKQKTQLSLVRLPTDSPKSQSQITKPRLHKISHWVHNK